MLAIVQPLWLSLPLLILAFIDVDIRYRAKPFTQATARTGSVHFKRGVERFNVFI